MVISLFLGGGFYIRIVELGLMPAALAKNFQTGFT